MVVGAATLTAIWLVRERRDIESEIAATEERSRELQTAMEGPAERIDDLEEEAEADLASGAECTSAAETGVEVLGALIRWLELSALREAEDAEKELRAALRLAGQANRSTRACAEGLGLPSKEEDVTVV